MASTVHVSSIMQAPDLLTVIDLVLVSIRNINIPFMCSIECLESRHFMFKSNVRESLNKCEITAFEIVCRKVNAANTK